MKTLNTKPGWTKTPYGWIPEAVQALLGSIYLGDYRPKPNPDLKKENMSKKKQNFKKINVLPSRWGNYHTVEHNPKKSWTRWLSIPILILFLILAYLAWRQAPTEKQIMFVQPDHVYAQDAKPTETPTPKHEIEYTIEDAVVYIWGRESSKGKNNGPGTLAYYCEQRGGWNELGFGGMDLKICFKNKTEGFDKVTSWVNARHDDNTLNISGILCTYRWGDKGKQGNGGDSCEYGKKFIEAHTNK